MHSHSEKNKKNLWFVLVLSAAYMVAEIIGGLASGSLALLADAGHLAIDTAAVGLGIFALWVSQKPPTPEKTFGYYRAEILAASANGALLVAVATGILFEAWQRFEAPPPIRGGLMALVAGGGLLINLTGLFLTHQGSHENLNVRGVWLHLLTDTLGSLCALIAALLIWKLGWFLADPIISVVLAFLILGGSFKLLSECVNVLLEGVPKGTDIQAIKTEIEALVEVRDIHDLHVWTVTSGVVALSAHVRLRDGANTAVLLETITELLHDKFAIEHATLQLEPPSYEHGKTHFQCQKV